MDVRGHQGVGQVATEVCSVAADDVDSDDDNDDDPDFLTPATSQENSQGLSQQSMDVRGRPTLDNVYTIVYCCWFV